MGTYADILRPKAVNLALIYDFSSIILGSGLIALAAQMAIDLAWSPVPISGQTFAVLLIGALLGRHRGTACILLYLGEGAVGLPVFAGASGGWPILIGPTGGYLIGFIGAAFITGFLSERGWDRRFFSTVLAMLLGNMVIYVFGLSWLSLFVENILETGLYPFVAGDLIKLVFAALLLPSGWAVMAWLKT